MMKKFLVTLTGGIAIGYLAAAFEDLRREGAFKRWLEIVNGVIKDDREPLDFVESYEYMMQMQWVGNEKPTARTTRYFETALTDEQYKTVGMALEVLKTVDPTNPNLEATIKAFYATVIAKTIFHSPWDKPEAERLSTEVTAEWMAKIRKVRAMHDEGYNDSQIAEQLSIHEDMVRILLMETA